MQQDVGYATRLTVRLRVIRMLKPAMNKHFFAILLLLLCLLVTVPAEARLTLCIVPGTQDSSGEVSLEQANALAELLTENLQEEVVVKELADSSTLINWRKPGSGSRKINKENCKKAMTKELYATEKVYELVKKGKSFREGYKEVKDKL